MAKGLCKRCYLKFWKINNRAKARDYNRKNRKALRKANPKKYRDKAKQKYRSLSWTTRALQQNTGRDQISYDFLVNLQKITTHCDCCGCFLDYNVYKRNKPRPLNTANLDKIIPSFGYTENNVSIICFRCNRMKGDMTLSDLKMLAAYIERKLNGR